MLQGWLDTLVLMGLAQEGEMVVHLGMLGDQGQGLAPDLVIAVLMVHMQVLEGVVQVVELANTGLDMVQGQDQVQGLVHIVKAGILVMENPLMLVVPVGVGVEDNPDIIPMLKDLVVALVLALAMLTGFGPDQVMQVQVLVAMVVAQEILKMLGLAVAQVPDLDTAMPTPELHMSQSKVGAHRPSLICLKSYSYLFSLSPLLHFC